MQKIDIAIIVLGVVVLASAVTGAMLYEPDDPSQTWTVNWAADTTSLDPVEDSVGASGGTASFDIDVTEENVTQGTFSVTVQTPSNHVNEDSITVNVTSPDGTSNEDSTTLAAGSSQATLEVSVQMATVPTVAKIQADSNASAHEKVAEEYTSRAGTGTWTVNVTVDHGGTGVAGDHSIEVTPTVGTYAAQISKAGPDVRAN